MDSIPTYPCPKTLPHEPHTFQVQARQYRGVSGLEENAVVITDPINVVTQCPGIPN